MTAILYSAPSSYYSMIARLALAEGGHAATLVRLDIHRHMEQFQPWYARLQPALTVPCLVLPTRRFTQSRDILRWALPPTEGDAATVESTLDRHYGFPVDELTFGWILRWNPLAAHAVQRTLRKSEARLRELARTHPELREVYLQRAEVFAQRQQTFDPAGVRRLYARRRAEAETLLTELAGQLEHGKTFLHGDRVGAADVVWTVFLARMCFVRMEAEITQREPLRRYYAAQRARPSFRGADLWDRLDPLKFLGQLL